MRSASKPAVVVTTGDTAGVGPEVVAGALADAHIRTSGRIFVMGSAAVLASCWRGTVAIRTDLSTYEPDVMNIIDTGDAPYRPGHPDAGSARAAFAALDRAVRYATAGAAAAIVTAPIYKKGMADIGFSHPGHTEFLAAAFRSKPLMTFWGRRLRVATVTTHLPLADVAGRIDEDGIADAVRTAARLLRERTAIARPRIAVLGLNPHAGEEGVLGSEERSVIAPACMRLREEGLDVCGPLPADAAMHHAWQGAFDFVIGMYHDQVLAPFKMVHFDTGVQVTAGLPVVRTSPDHGTAFDIAGTGRANSTSMRNAIRLAVTLSARRRS